MEVNDGSHIRVENVFSIFAANPLYKAPVPSFRMIRRIRLSAEGFVDVDLPDEAATTASFSKDAWIRVLALYVH